MLELIKNYFSHKNKLWKIILIISVVLFLLVLSTFIWRLFFYQRAQRGGDNFIESAQGKERSPGYSQKCAGCVRRLIDGVYVKPEEANLPPLAIIIDNHPSARPQIGLEKASLIYEAEVEGNYTRFMAVFATAEEISQIGPVRSARPYFVDWAQELNAVYVHCGGSPEALVDLEQKNMVDLNEFYNGQYFWRTTDRTAPHDVLTSSANLNKFLENKKITSGDYSFWQFKDDSPANNASTTKKISINFNHPDFKTAWLYDKTINSYTRYFEDTPYLTTDNNHIIAKNIIIQYVPAKVVDDKLRLEMENVGIGNAIICFDGFCQKGKWDKENYQIRTKFSFENGDEVKFNAGTTWIEVVRPEVDVNY